MYYKLFDVCLLANARKIFCQKLYWVCIFSVAAVVIGSASASAQITLPTIFRDSMVLQRGKPIDIWGKASPQEKLSVQFNGSITTTKANANGEWKMQLPTQNAGGPYTMQLKGKNTITLHDVLVGDVWFASGQSNMVHQMNIHDVTYAEEIATANYPQIRQFLVPNNPVLTGPETHANTSYWAPAVGEQVRPFSAVAYFFAKQLYERYKIPIGIINSSVGGTPIEAWTSEAGLQSFADISTVIQRNKDSAYINSFKQANAQSAGSSAQQPTDKGLQEKWFATAYKPIGWRNINIPGYWEDQGIRNLDGVVWYRREIDVPASMAANDAKVFLGRIVDADVLYVNGAQVSNTTYMYPQRRYKLPSGILHAGKNLFVIRVSNQNGKGGFVPDKPYQLISNSDTVDLQGNWQYKVGEVFAPRNAGAGNGISLQNQPTALYNGMVAPFVPYGIKGFLWYQGESNAGRPSNYLALQKALVQDWRKQWQQPSLPFLYVQLPNYMDVNYTPEESNWALMREAQGKALSVPNTAMAVAIDLGEWNDVHPDNKKAVGDRLALAAQKMVYGENIIASGPMFEKASVQNDKIVISFTHTGTGLTTNDGGMPDNFAIAGDDKKFVWANARIEGNTVVVWSKTVAAPRYVRYAWADNPHNANLYNKEGLPASPFRTDE